MAFNFRIDARVEQCVKKYCDDLKIDDQKEIDKISEICARCANEILAAARFAESQGLTEGKSDKKGLVNSSSFVMHLLKDDQRNLLRDIVKSVWDLNITYSRLDHYSIGSRLGSTVELYPIFSITWPESMNTKNLKPEIKAPISSLNADFSLFQNYRKNNFLTDMVFCCENEKFPAHRIVLACRSKFFEGAFKSFMKESYSPEFPIDLESIGTDAASFATFLDFLYLGVTKLESKSISEIRNLLALAHLYQVDSLIQACVYELVKQLDATNIDEIYGIGETYSIQELIQQCDWLAGSEMERLLPLEIPEEFEKWQAVDETRL